MGALQKSWNTLHVTLIFLVLAESSSILSQRDDKETLKFEQQRAGYPGPFMRFLVAVNFTEGPCLATVVTQSLQPHTKYNMSDAVKVGDCDKGPLDYEIVWGKKEIEKVSLTFHSSVILDASPPTCDILWHGSYLLPVSGNFVGNRLPSLLPGCFVMDSREGAHMTYYWFYILDWGF